MKTYSIEQLEKALWEKGDGSFKADTTYGTGKNLFRIDFSFFIETEKGSNQFIETDCQTFTRHTTLWHDEYLAAIR